MTREQFKAFVSECAQFAISAHFDDDRYVRNYSSDLDTTSFCDVVAKNWNIANKIHCGVCFTMTCWGYWQLYVLGISDNYYMLETFEKETSAINYVLLYEVESEYRICDLAALVLKSEEIRAKLMAALLSDDPNGEKDSLIISLSDTSLLSQKVEDYLEKCTCGGFVLEAKGIDDDRNFNDIPRADLIEFLCKKGITR